jgi:hypothetical protein
VGRKTAAVGANGQMADRRCEEPFDADCGGPQD